jgi:hypothetical protein
MLFTHVHQTAHDAGFTLSLQAMAVALGKDQSLSVFAKAFGATYHDS